MSNEHEDALRKYFNESKPTFDSKHIRVSGIGYCQRLQVAKALGMVSTAQTIEHYYSHVGHMCEELLGLAWPTAERQINVPIPNHDAFTHPDFYFSASRNAVECKTVEDDALPRLTKPKTAAHKQVLLNWHYWSVASLQQKAPQVPERYWVVYCGRNGWAMNRKWFEVKYDRQEADELDRTFQDSLLHVKLGTLPPRLPKMGWECKTHTGAQCAMYDYCWGEDNE